MFQASVELLFRLYEIPLQIIRHYCSQINSLSLKIVFVTFRESVSYKQAAKRCPFALQNMPFYTSKDALLHCKRASLRTRKGVDGKAGRKEIDKKNSLPKPLQRRGCERKRWDMGGSLSLELQPPQAPPKEGMYLAGYEMLGVGEMERGRFKAKSSWVNSQRSKLWWLEICFVAFNLFTCQSLKAEFVGINIVFE